MKVEHISDTHGVFPKLSNCDVVIHSGDFSINSSYCPEYSTEVAFQSNWIRRRAQTILDWIDNRKFVYCAGNHDYTSPVDVLKQSNMIDCTNKLVEVDGVKIYGFPYTEVKFGWNYELDSNNRNSIHNKFLDDMEKCSPDILVSHAPPYGYHDLVGFERVGSQIVRHVLDNFPIKYVMCGHIHCSSGITTLSNGKVISNAATKHHLFDLI